MSDEQRARGASGPARRRTWGAVAAVACVAFAACGGDDTGRDDDVHVAADTTPDTSPLDVATADGSAGFRAPCRDNRDCASGWCVASADGAVCTQGCEEGCPLGWDCVPVVNLGIDTVSICADRSMTLCQPCLVDADCQRFSPGADNRCLDYGADGRFCGQACAEGVRPCPLGYSCDDDGDGVGQCVPDDGVCACNPLGAELELATRCHVANEHGTCVGARVCGVEGLTACDARVPSVEVCNGVDDDCDGLTDEGLLAGAPCLVVNAHGSCPGVGYCVGGAEECIGAAARPEECNGYDDDCDGLTDEGFPDTDGDGVADCVDPDIDGDGTPNAEDCAPYDPLIHPGAVEVCDGVDNDCDGLTDEEGAVGCVDYYRDVDGDGYGSSLVAPRCLCAPDVLAGYTADNGEDCDDLDPLVYPGAPERCNGKDDSCDGVTDEGVQAPCGGCVNMCIVESGPGTTLPFAIGPSSSGVELDANGALRLVAGQTLGTYRHVITGWPQSNTRWTVIFMDGDLPGGGVTSLTLRHRGAATPAALATAPWSTTAGPYPPANFPLLISVIAPLIEVELTLATGDAGLTPLVRELSVLGESVP